MDVHPPKTRSYNMSKIKGKDTKPELLLRSALHLHGIRFRLHSKDLQGKPDIVFPKYRAVIFVHGCFWHRHKCKNSAIPATRNSFWTNKFRENKKRDRRNVELLLDQGWRVMIVWECLIKRLDPSGLSLLGSTIFNWLHSDVPFDEIE